MARDGANHMMMQLHRVRLDGKNDVRLTDPAFNHRSTSRPTGNTSSTSARRTTSRRSPGWSDAKGKVVAELAKSDLTKFDQLGLKKTELFTFKAADGTTDLFGILHFPSNFDPAKKYPLLVSVYAGPGWNGARETFGAPPARSPSTASSSPPSTSAGRLGQGQEGHGLHLPQARRRRDRRPGRRRQSRSASRPYVDKDRVGIFGTSYGGYASAMCLLRHPDVFAAACAMSAVTSWYQYDSIYTERYMWIPQENKDGYEAGNAMNYVKNLKGRLMIYYGTADNNVHPTNAMQLIQALQARGQELRGPGRARPGAHRPQPARG